MDESDFEGSVILEKLAEFGKVDEFFAAVDADNFKHVSYLLRFANFDDEVIDMVLKKMSDGED